jgi:hypothetical protein
LITAGFGFELGKGALEIESKQNAPGTNSKSLTHISYISTESTKIA